MKINKFIIASMFVFGLIACVDQEFDEPPLNGEDPDITANATLDEVKAFLTLGQITEITDDLIVRVTVTADDESGNLYRTIVVEDESGGISLLINNTELYNIYPEGRRLFIKCQGLHIGDYEGLPQLGGNPYDDDGEQRIGGIAEAVLDQFVIPGVWGLEIVPTVRTINELGSNDLNTLVLLENVEFSFSSVNMTYADAENQFSVNHTIQDCNGSDILLRSSGFASFANDITPSGNGDLTAIYTVFRNDKQLVIRDPSDVAFDGERCSGGTDCETLNLKCLRDAFHDGASEAPEGNLTGIVISDYTNSSVTSRNLHLQDNSGGIVVRFNDDHSFALGEELTLNVTGVELSEFNGLLQLNNVPLNNASSAGQGTIPAARVTTISEIIANAEAWESTLIELSEVSFSGNTTYGGDVDVTDDTGTILMFTRSSASFAGDALPESAEKMTAILTDFNEPQLILRSPELDIEGAGGGGGGGDDELNEDFQGFSDDQDISGGGWTNVAVAGTRLWRAQEFDGNVYAQATSFNDTNPTMEAWLITPGLDSEEVNTLRFESAMAFYDHDGLTVWISTDFSGNVESANWEQLNPTLAGSSDDDHAWIPSGDIDLSDYSGTIHIGFKYIGDNTNNDTSYRVDNLVIE